MVSVDPVRSLITIAILRRDAGETWVGKVYFDAITITNTPAMCRLRSKVEGRTGVVFGYHEP